MRARDTCVPFPIYPMIAIKHWTSGDSGDARETGMYPLWKNTCRGALKTETKISRITKSTARDDECCCVCKQLEEKCKKVEWSSERVSTTD